MALIQTLTVAENVMFNDLVMNMGHKKFVNYGKRSGKMQRGSCPFKCKY